VVRARCVRGTCLAPRRDVVDGEAAVPVAPVEPRRGGANDDVARAPFARKSATERRWFGGLPGATVAGTSDALQCSEGSPMTVSLPTTTPMKRASSAVALGLSLAGILVAGGLGVGCVTRNYPSSIRIESSEAAIRSARDLGADRIPDAAVHLELAQRQLDQAHHYIDQGDDNNARWMLVRADADAHLALALTRETRTREAAEEMAARVRDLSSSMHVTSPGPL